MAVLQPQPQTPKPQPQPRDTAPSPLDKPWEAIRPVQPHPDSGSYRRQHQQQQASSTGPPPPPPARSVESKLATAALSRTEPHYHAFLEDEGSPLALSHALTLPRKSSYVYHAHAQGHDPADPYYAPARALPLAYAYRAEPLPLSLGYATIGPRSYHHSLKAHRPIRSEYLPSPSPGHAHHHHRSHGYSHVGPAYPTIRRVHSLHAPSPAPPATVRGPPVSRTEVPPLPSDEEMFYYQRAAHRCHGYVSADQQQDYHVTRLQPFFENGRVQYRYSPYAEREPALPADAAAHYYQLDPYATVRLRHAHSFGGRERDADGGKSGAYHYLLHQRHAPHPHGHAHPHHQPRGGPGGVKEHGFVSRDVPPHAQLHAPQGPSVGGVCLAWEAQEEAERLRGHAHSHSLRREGRTRQRLKGPVLSQYDNLHLGPCLPPDPPDPPRGPQESLQHLRSKSDPGKEARYNVTPEVAMPRSQTADPDAFLYMETEKHGPSHTHPHARAGPRSHTPSSSHLPEASRADDPADGPLPRPTPKPERSQSRGPRGPDAEPHTHTHSHVRPQRHPHSSALSHYDNLEEYRPTHTLAQDPLACRGGAALFPGQAFSSTGQGQGQGHGGRAYSTALGQGAFIQTDPAQTLLRPEAQVKVE